MSGLKGRITSLACTLILASGAWAATATTQPDSNADVTPAPKPDYTPQQVVHIQLDALGRNDDPTPDHGIAVAFAFASPANQKATGPVEKFARMIKSPEYRPLLDHRAADYGDTHVDGPEAQLLVKVTASDGEAALYLFVLARQTDGKYQDCWMTDGVMRLRPQDIAPGPPAAPDQGGDGGGDGGGGGHDKT
jgi:hypothetical protein